MHSEQEQSALKIFGLKFLQSFLLRFKGMQSFMQFVEQFDNVLNSIFLYEMLPLSLSFNCSLV